MAFKASNSFTKLIIDTIVNDGSKDLVTNDTPARLHIIDAYMPGMTATPGGPPVNPNDGQEWLSAEGVPYTYRRKGLKWVSDVLVAPCMWCGKWYPEDLVDQHEEGCA